MSHAHIRALKIIALIAAATPPAVLAQGVPGTNVKVAVRIARISLRGDTTRIEYRVKNDQHSREDLFEFTVEAPSKVHLIELPNPHENWDTGTTYKTLSVASWAMLNDLPRPGETTPPLAFEAVGLPGVTTYWAMGWFPVPPLDEEEDTLPPLSPREAIAANSVEGQTVGIEPFPSDRTPASLLLRLDGLRVTACGKLAWIESVPTCSRLGTLLREAIAAVQSGNTARARARLQSFQAELDSERRAGRPEAIEAAVWLLGANAEYILRSLK